MTSDNADRITVIMLLSTTYCKQCDLNGAFQLCLARKRAIFTLINTNLTKC